MPGKMWCDGPRQEAVFRASTHRTGSNSSASSRVSQPVSRGVPVVAAGSTGSSGGGALHVVPAGSSHGSFTDLPFLLNPWVTKQLRRLVSEKL